MAEDSGIVLSNQAIQQGRATRKWKHVSHMLAVKNIRIVGGTRQVIVGRALGDRDDDQCFFAEVDLPFIVPAKWDWKKEARRRLHSYLDSRCTCESGKSAVKHCDWHRVELFSEWQKIDFALNRESQAVATPAHITQAVAGPLVTARILHWNFPWVRHDRERGGIWCELCGAFQEPFPQNPSYQNLFIHEHSACGFPAAGYAKSIAECNLDYYSQVAVVLRKKRSQLHESVMDLDVLTHYAEAQKNASLPERMSEEEAVKLIREKLVGGGNVPTRP